MMFERSLKPLKNHSFFLFGARATGKTTLIHALFREDEMQLVDLLDPALMAELQARPERLTSLIEESIDRERVIVIDEVQKVPELLNVVHQLIESRGAKFGLTGSSARKLRRGASNLLAGRAFTYRLFPLMPVEVGDAFNLGDAINWGTLPSIYGFDDNEAKSRYLRAYADTYLREEIIVEQVVRRLPPFRRFLEVAAQANSEIVNYSRIARDIDSDATSVKNYFQILDDTLIGFFLEPHHRSVRKRQGKSPKFYFIDTGIVRALAGRLDVPTREGTFAYGRLFETFIINIIRSTLDYSGKQYRLSFIRTKDGAEIDLIVERGGRETLLIEIKSSERVDETMLRNLRSFAADIPNSRPIVLYRGKTKRRIAGVDILPWQIGIETYI